MYIFNMEVSGKITKIKVKTDKSKVRYGGKLVILPLGSRG